IRADRHASDTFVVSVRRMDMPFAVVEHGAVVEDRGAATVVPWWSFTKTAIATAALALVRDGRLALGTPLPGRAFTLGQLLQHRAGLQSIMRRSSATRNGGRWRRCSRVPRPTRRATRPARAGGIPTSATCSCAS